MTPIELMTPIEIIVLTVVPGLAFYCLGCLAAVVMVICDYFWPYKGPGTTKPPPG